MDIFDNCFLPVNCVCHFRQYYRKAVSDSEICKRTEKKKIP